MQGRGHRQHRGLHHVAVAARAAGHEVQHGGHPEHRQQRVLEGALDDGFEAQRGGAAGARELALVEHRVGQQALAHQAVERGVGGQGDGRGEADQHELAQPVGPAAVVADRPRRGAAEQDGEAEAQGHERGLEAGQHGHGEQRVGQPGRAPARLVAQLALEQEHDQQQHEAVQRVLHAHHREARQEQHHHHQQEHAEDVGRAGAAPGAGACRPGSARRGCPRRRPRCRAAAGSRASTRGGGGARPAAASTPATTTPTGSAPRPRPRCRGAPGSGRC